MQYGIVNKEDASDIWTYYNLITVFTPYYEDMQILLFATLFRSIQIYVYIVSN